MKVVLMQPGLPRELAAARLLKNRLPLLAPSAEFALAGVLMAYSTRRRLSAILKALGLTLPPTLLIRAGQVIDTAMQQETSRGLLDNLEE